MDIREKYEKLQGLLKQMGRVAVAFSGGVDSAFLLAAAREALGEGVLAVTASSPSFPAREQAEAETFCRERGISQVVFASEEMKLEAYRKNPPDRCYICKRSIFGKIREIAEGHHTDWVIEGSNTDDEGDYRPGMRAIKELGIRSPLREAGFSKAEIRALSKEMGIPTWEKPSFACLASRFAYGERIDEKRIAMVGRAEQFLLDQGFAQVRVRIHGSIARIEVLPGDIARLAGPGMRERVAEELKALGFTYVALDLVGYRTGSMNEVL